MSGLTRVELMGLTGRQAPDVKTIADFRRDNGTGNTHVPAAEVVPRYKSLAGIELLLRVPNSDIEIGPGHHRPPRRIRAHALVCFVALIQCRVIRMQLG